MQNKTLYPGLLTLALAVASPINAKELIEPIVLSSNPSTKTLNVLMIAEASTSNPFPNKVQSWVFDICERKSKVQNSCPAKLGPANLYGGTRLQLNPGDTLKVHLVNKLPKIVDSDAASGDPAQAYLAQNPVNLHTHGMLVSPNMAASNVFGDSIYVLAFNSANGAPNTTSGSHIHGAINTDATDYQITIPKHHPSGLFWFHPHTHGISLNQITAGLSGIITIGKIRDYLPGIPADTNVRHLILKDTQINADNTINDQLDPGFCDQPAGATNECTSNDGGSWNFTVNGQIQPTISVKPNGEIWRLTNASGSAIYNLQLTDTKSKSAMVMQLLSIDGVSAIPAQSLSNATITQMGAGKYTSIPCPNVNTMLPDAICIDQLHMMPGTRAEVWVVNRDSSQQVLATGKQAVFESTGYLSGVAGDNWPAATLANINFIGNKKLPPSKLAINTNAIGDTAVDFSKVAKDLSKANTLALASDVSDGSCQSLPPGYKRRIFFGYPTATTFGLGMELIDQYGNAVPGSFQDVIDFPQPSSICIPLGPNNTTVTEQWELVNLTGEDHNFHIHQTKFRVLSESELSAGLTNLSAMSILQDSVPILTGSANCDGTVATWRTGSCQSSPITVEIPFSISGNFVYHCHILEHEDKGMMSNIHIVSNNGK